MNQNIIHQRQMPKNNQFVNNQKIEDNRGISECYEKDNSPRKYDSLIKRFNKKPSYNENSHLKYLKNGIKDISNRNMNFQLQNTENQSCVQQIERLNAIQRIAEKLSENEQPRTSMNYQNQNNKQTQFNAIQNNQETFTNTYYDNQGIGKPIRTICLNLFDQQKQDHPNINENWFWKEQMIDTQQYSENKNSLEQDKLYNTLSLNFQQQINLAKVPPETSFSALSNSTRFSPRYSKSGINYQSSSSLVSQVCNKQQKDESETKQGIDIIFDQYESSQNNLNLNYSALTTPSKYQQGEQQCQNGLYYYENNNKFNLNASNIQNKQLKDSQLFSSYFQNNQQSSIMHNNNAQQDDSFYNKKSISPNHKQKISLSPDHSGISKVNLSIQQLNTSKSYFVSGTSSHLNSNMHSRKSSSQIQINDSNNSKMNFNMTPKNNRNTQEIQNNLTQYNYSLRDSQNKPLHNHSHSLISNIASSSQSTMNTTKISNYNPLSRKTTKDSIKTFEQTPSLSKKMSSRQQYEETNYEINNQNTSNQNSHINRIQSQIINQNNCQLQSNKLQLVQNMNRIQLISSTASQNTQKLKERDNSLISMKGENKSNNVQRSTSKGNLILKNKSLSQQTQSALNKSQLNALNQSNTITSAQGNNNSKQTTPTQSSGFNFQPQYFTPIDNDQMQVYLSKQTSRSNSQVREKTPQQRMIQNQQVKTNNTIKQKQQDYIQQEFKTTNSFIELESQLQNNLKSQQQQQFEFQKKLKLFS